MRKLDTLLKRGLGLRGWGWGNGLERVKVGVQNPPVNDATAQDTDDGVWFMMVEVQNNLDTWEGL